MALLSRSVAVEGLLTIAIGIIQMSCRLLQHTGTEQSSHYTVGYHKQREGEWSEQCSLLLKKAGQNMN